MDCRWRSHNSVLLYSFIHQLSQDL